MIRTRRAARAAASPLAALPAVEQMAIGMPDKIRKRASDQSPDAGGDADVVAIADSPPPSPARVYGKGVGRGAVIVTPYDDHRSSVAASSDAAQVFRFGAAALSEAR